MSAAAHPTPVPILLFHGVADDVDGPAAPWVVSPERFAQYLDAIDAAGCRPVTISRLVSMMDDPAGVPTGTVALTFDDGFADFASGALPALVDRGWPSTLYVTTGGVGGHTTWMGPDERRAMLSWEELRGVADEQVEIGAHTEHHPQLDIISPERARDEIVQSRDRLEDALGRSVPSFAYPHGYHDRRVRQLVVDAGFRSACAVKHAMSSIADDRFALSRVMVRHRDAPELVGRWASGQGLPVAIGGSVRLRTTAWRHVRRARAKWGVAA